MQTLLSSSELSHVSVRLHELIINLIKIYIALYPLAHGAIN